MDSATVGRSGSTEERCALVTARPRTAPDCTCGAAVRTRSNISETCPEMRSFSAGALPLYGTCTMSIPVIDLSSSPARWLEVPLPAEE